MSATGSKPTSAEDLVGMIYHTDGRVSAVESKLDAQGQQLNRIEAAVLNKPPAWNNSNVMALALVVGSFLVGITGYVSMQLSPVNQAIVEFKEIANESLQFQKQTHYEFGRLSEWKEEHVEAFKHHDELYHELERRVDILRQQAAAAEVSRKAIGDYAKEKGGLIDNLLANTPR